MKQCTKCLRYLEIEHFGKHPSTKDRRQSWCKECTKQCIQEYLQTHPKKGSQYSRASYLRNWQQRKEYRDRNKEKRKQYDKEHRPKVRERKKELQRKYNKNDIIQALVEYGGKCWKCGEDRIWALTLGHTMGDGKKHRETIGIKGGSRFARWLKKHGYPKNIGIATECFSCNLSTGQGKETWRKLESDNDWMLGIMSLGG